LVFHAQYLLLQKIERTLKMKWTKRFTNTQNISTSMASKKYTLILGLLSLFSSAAFSQQNDAGFDWRDSSKLSTKSLPQHSEFLNNQYPYPAKPRDMWEFGVHGGLSLISGDVSPNAGIGGGLSLRKSLGHTFSVRGQYIGSFNRGIDYRLRSNSQIPGNATPNPWAAYGNNGFVPNYKAGIHQGALDVIAVLNNRSHYRGNPKTNIYVFAGYTMLTADVDVIVGPNKRPPSNFFNGINFSTTAKRKDIKEAVKTRLGGDLDYSANGVNAPALNPKRDPIRTINDNQLLRHGLTGGGGIALRLSPKFNIALEQRFTTVFDDNLDGLPIGRSASDIIMYTSGRLNFNLGSTARKTEPLWWINPYNFIYNELNAPQHMKLPKPILPDADGDGVTDQFDMEPNTPQGAPVDVRGVSRDTDGDGVPDYKDKELLTSQKCFPVDADGVGTCPEPACCKELRDLVAQGGMKGGECAISNLPSVQFRSGTTLSRDAQAVLTSAAAQIKANPTCKIRVTGHGASDKRAQQLSWDRVNAVIRFLVERQGIAEDRFIFTYGEQGDAMTVDLAGTTEEGPNTVPAPHPNLRRG
jgi:OOP family OmpA-OmpF porin